MISWGLLPSTVQPTDWHVPRISLITPSSFRAIERGRIIRAMSTMSSMVKFPECLTENKKHTEHSKTCQCNKPNSTGQRRPTVLHFLPVSRSLLERLDDEWCCRGDDVNFRHAILNGQLHGHFQALPVLCGLGNVLSYFLGSLWTQEHTRKMNKMIKKNGSKIMSAYQTQRTDLRGEGCCCSHFSTNCSEANCAKNDKRYSKSYGGMHETMDKIGKKSRDPQVPRADSTRSKNCPLPVTISLGSNFGGIFLDDETLNDGNDENPMEEGEWITRKLQRTRPRFLKDEDLHAACFSLGAGPAYLGSNVPRPAYFALVMGGPSRLFTDEF